MEDFGAGLRKSVQGWRGVGGWGGGGGGFSEKDLVSVPVPILPALLPVRPSTVRGLKLPAHMAATVHGSQIQL